MGAAQDAIPITSALVTMGSPFASPGSSNASWLWQMITREELPRLPPEQLQRLAAPIPVPATAIYTRGDGVVRFQAASNSRRRRRRTSRCDRPI